MHLFLSGDDLMWFSVFQAINSFCISVLLLIFLFHRFLSKWCLFSDKSLNSSHSFGWALYFSSIFKWSVFTILHVLFFAVSITNLCIIPYISPSIAVIFSVYLDASGTATICIEVNLSYLWSREGSQRWLKSIYWTTGTTFGTFKCYLIAP